MRGFIGVIDAVELNNELQSSPGSLFITDICKEPRKYSTEELNSLPYKQPAVSYFRVADSVLQTAELFSDLRTSRIFNDGWRSHCALAAQFLKNANDAQVCDIVLHLWPPYEEKWSNLCSEFVDGTVLVESVDEIFSQCDSDYQRLEREINIMFSWVNTKKVDTTFASSDADIVAERLKQIKIYKQLAHYYSGISEILDARDQLKLTGDFTDLEDLHTMVNSFQCYMLRERTMKSKIRVSWTSV